MRPHKKRGCPGLSSSGDLGSSFVPGHCIQIQAGDDTLQGDPQRTQLPESQAAGRCRENVKRCRLSRNIHAVTRTQPSRGTCVEACSTTAGEVDGGFVYAESRLAVSHMRVPAHREVQPACGRHTRALVSGTVWLQSGHEAISSTAVRDKLESKIVIITIINNPS